MNTIRSIISTLLLALITVAVLGWRWSARLPSPRLESARVVLTLAGVAALLALGLVWQIKPRVRG